MQNKTLIIKFLICLIMFVVTVWEIASWYLLKMS